MSAVTITLGEDAILTTLVEDEDGNLTDDDSTALSLTAPDGTQILPNVTHVGLGSYSVDYVPMLTGRWRWRWVSTNIIRGASEGTFEIVSIYQGAVTDQRDLRVLIPACRRAIDGPTATSPDAPSTTLTDPEVLGSIADATGSLILYTRDTFGLELQVTARDPFYMAPVAWQTDKNRSTAADAAILSQAALDHYFQIIRLLKVSETMKNEAVEWSYAISANVLAAWIKYLQDNRDRALEAMELLNQPLDVMFSTVAERDRLSAAWLEPWVQEIGAPVPYVGGGGSGPLEYDFRFNSWG